MSALIAPTPAVLECIRTLSPDQLPAYVYDLTALREHATAVRAALPAGVELYYAAKANPDAALLTTLSPHVDGYEVSSVGELDHVSQTVPGRPLAFGGPGKTPAELTRALELGVARFHVESLHELRLLSALAAGRTPATRPAVLLRFNLPMTGDSPAGSPLTGSTVTMGGRPTPFGLDPAEADEAVNLAATHLELRGIHAHLASGLDAVRQLAVAEEVVTWAAKLAARHGIRFTEVNVGGGMEVDYAAPERRFDWAVYGAGLAQLTEAGSVLRVEPGRALTAYCGWYAAEVLDIKQNHGEEFAVLGGGTHHLRTSASRGHDQPCGVIRCDGPWPHAWPRPTSRQERITLTGQLCTPKDVLARRIPATGLRVADRVAFSLAGAYAWNVAHRDFLMHPHPGFHYIG